MTQASESAPTIKYTYPTGNPVTAPFATKTETRIDAYTTPTYQSSWTFYDGMGRVIQTQAQAENNWLVVQSAAYDARGLTITATLPYTRSGSGGVYITPTWNSLAKSVTTYDALGRATQVIAPDATGPARLPRLARDRVGRERSSDAI